MAIRIELMDYDELFRSVENQGILVINDLDPSIVNDWRTFRDSIISRYEQDTLSVIPSCDQGCSQGGLLLGSTCPYCGTKVEIVTDKKFLSDVWMEAPSGIDGFIHPMAYRIFSKTFKSKGVNLIDWLLLGRVKVPKGHKAVERLKTLKIQRGLNAFIRNFDTIMEQLMRSSMVSTTVSRSDLVELGEWIENYRPLLFPKHLPMPSRLAFISEESQRHAVVDENCMKIIDAASTILYMEDRSLNPDEAKIDEIIKKKEQCCVKCVKQLTEFYDVFLKKNIGHKTGWVRKNVISSRLNFTFRGVITSIACPHDVQELHMPWCIAVNVFSTHIKSYLLKGYGGTNYTPVEMEKLLFDHSFKYHPLLDDILSKIITGHKFGKYPVLFQRNPSLLRGSTQQLFVTRIKKDPKEMSIGISILALKLWNADFDGDELTGMLVIDDYTYQRVELLSPHYSLYDATKPRAISSKMNLPAPLISTIANWYNEQL